MAQIATGELSFSADDSKAAKLPVFEANLDDEAVALADSDMKTSAVLVHSKSAPILYPLSQAAHLV
jgi:hypothetical protein